jgi:hypothetical protein
MSSDKMPPPKKTGDFIRIPGIPAEWGSYNYVTLFHGFMHSTLAEKPLLLVVDDDPLISDALGYAFANDFDVVTSHSRPHCLACSAVAPSAAGGTG